MIDTAVWCGMAHLSHGQITRQSLSGVDLENIAPLGEAGALCVGLGAASLQGVKAFVHGLRVTKGSDSSARDPGLVVALVELDARDHAARGDDVNHLLPLQ